MARAGQRPLCGAAVPAGDSLRWWEDESALGGLSASPTSFTSPACGARAAGTELPLWRGWTRGRRPGGVLGFLGPAPARSYFRPLSRGPLAFPEAGGGPLMGRAGSGLWLLQGVRPAQRLALSFLGPGLQEKTL